MAQDINKQTQKPMALLLGAGYSARAIGVELVRAGYDVWGTTRSEEQAVFLRTFGIDPIISSDLNSEQIKSKFCDAHVIISSVPPNKSQSVGHFDPVLEIFSGIQPKAKWIGYLSATSVYGDRQGKWAFEGEAARPQLKRGKARAEAELEWFETGWPVHIFRLAGIYGPDKYGRGRNPFEKLRQGKARAVIKDGHVVNRIHVEDIAQAIMASIRRPNPQAIYNLADGSPAPPQDVLDYAAELIGGDKPSRVSVKHESVSAMARSFYSETKRIDISRAKKELSWTPKYSDYKTGLKAILDNS